MNLEAYLNQDNPRPQSPGSVILKEDEVRVVPVGGEGMKTRIGWAIHIPRIRERFGEQGAKGDYFLKKPPYAGWNDRQLWTIDEDGNPRARSVFALGFDPK